MARRDGNPIIRDVPRERDEELLAWIRMRCRGVPASRIAQLYGSTAAAVILTTNKVREADAAESGEKVRGSYW